MGNLGVVSRRSSSPEGEVVWVSMCGEGAWPEDESTLDHGQCSALSQEDNER